MAGFIKFDNSLIKFLRELEKNNDREWFAENKPRYEEEVLFPALAFVEAFAPALKKISPHFRAVPKRVGGSVMRVYRDTRFSKDKTPYKTNVGIHFRHEMGKDVHCPGFYLHIAPKECFVGAGIWHPDSKSLGKIREAIDDRPAEWKRARDNKKFKSNFELTGDSLKRHPRGYDPEHKYIVDLKRKDHIGIKSLTAKDVTSRRLVTELKDMFVSSKPYMRFLCNALHIPF